MRNPSFIYFDLGNVLLNFSHELGCQQMADVAGVPFEDVRRFAFDSPQAVNYERGKVTTREFYEFFCDQTNTSPDLDQLTAAGSDIFQINTPILPVVSQLIQHGVRIGILSNTCDMHWRWIVAAHYGLVPRYFSTHALSFELGVTKPDRQIYVAAAKLAGVAPDQIFYTDDIAGHVSGALQAGFDAVQFTSASQLAAELNQRGMRIAI